VAAIVLVTMYLVNNAVDAGDPLGWLRLLTPFHWVNQSRALVPGSGASIGAMAVLTVSAVVLLVLAGIAFQRRDYGAALWSNHARAMRTSDRTAPDRTSPDRPAARHASIQRWSLSAPWRASLREHRLGIAGWVAASAAFAALMMMLQPAAMDVFEEFSYYLSMVGGAGTTPESMYATFITDVIAPIVAAFVITQAAGWVAELDQGRVEMLLASPLTWTGLVWQRIGAACVGAAAITVASLAVIGIGSRIVGADLPISGLVRTGIMCLLLAWVIAALAAVAVAALRSTAAITIVAAYAAFAYLLTWMIPMFGWPTWTERLSVFAAFGHPYREWPPVGSVGLLIAIALIASIGGASIAERTPKLR
jgi:ABC-2 type transport system permease protein